MADTVDNSEVLAKRVAQYIQIRDKLKAMEEEHTKKCAPLREIQNLLSGYMEQFLTNNGADTVKTKNGTFYSSTRYTASLSDADAFMNFVTTNKLFELMDRRANSTAVKDYVKANGHKPPGVNLTAIRTIGVRVPGTKKED